MRRQTVLRLPVAVSLLLAGTVLACNTEVPAPGAGTTAVPLVDRWPDVRIERPTPLPEVPPQAELRFDGSGVELAWSAVDGVADLEVEGGRLRGRATSNSPVILLETAAPLGHGDALWSVEIEVEASAGTKVAVHPMPSPGPPMPAVLGRDHWPISSPLLAGDESTTYTVVLDNVFTQALPMAVTDVSRVLVRPTNAEGAEFSIAAVRLVFRLERLASIASGPGWHGLGEVFRETLVSRGSETLGFEVTLPERPWLDLAVGSVAEPPKFRVAVKSAGGEAETVAELEVESPESWHPARIDLGRWAGQAVEVRLQAETDDDSTIAFWGAPTVRSAVDSGGGPPRAVILLVIDTLRSDHLEAWGYGRETAPTLARLASEGTRFADAVAQATWTKPSVAVILTSLYPSTSGIRNSGSRVAAAETTLAEVYREAGYATFAVSANPFTGQLTNLHQGVEVLHEFGSLRVDGDDPMATKSAGFWVDTFLEWLDLHHDVPFFASLHFLDPHDPFLPRAPYDTMWAGPEAAERFAEQEERIKPHIGNARRKRDVVPTRAEIAAAGVDEAAFVAYELDWYDGSIRSMDDQLARLLARLEELGLGDDALVAFVSDHGEGFLEHGLHGHGQNVYGELANVPLAFWGRGVPSGLVVEETVQTVDLMPTLLELSGLPVPERAQGQSLVGFMNGSERARPAFMERLTDNPAPDQFESFAMIDGRWKLIWNVDAPEGVAEHELYDHDADPLDLTDVAAEHPDVVERLAPELERWRAWTVSRKLDAAAAEAAITAEDLKRLRSLGYVD